MKKLKHNVFLSLFKFKVREQDLLKKRLALQKRRIHWLNVSALKQMKLFTRKMMDFKSDPITYQFADLDGAVIIEDETLMIMNSDDSHKYFDVNAKMVN